MTQVPVAEKLDGDVAARIRTRRPHGELRPIDQVLLHSPPLAEAWNTLLGTIRGGLGVPADLRELAILRVAVLNSAPYEWVSHEDDARNAGLGDAQLEALRRAQPAASDALSDVQRAVVRLTDVMTRDVTVPADVLDAVSRHFDPPQIVEIVATVAAYNMVSRVIVALDVRVPDEGEAS